MKMKIVEYKDSMGIVIFYDVFVNETVVYSSTASESLGQIQKTIGAIYQTLVVMGPMTVETKTIAVGQ